MKVAVTSDVHANCPALGAVLDDLTDIDRIIHAGDVVGYNPFPSEVIETFRTRDVISVAGNHDRGVTGDSEFEFSTAARRVIEWTRTELSNDQLEYIAALDSTRKLTIDGRTFQIVHGSPTDSSEYVYPTDLTLDMVDELDDDIDVFVWGHTHYPIVTKINDLLLVNPGSVGKPRDGDWRASYAVFDTRTEKIELRRQTYNIDKILEKANAESFPQQSIDSLPRPDTA